MSVSLPGFNRLSADISSLLEQRGLHGESIRVARCYGYKQCQSRYCLRCMSRRVLHQRKHLLVELPALLRKNPKAQLWFITSVAADSPDVRSHAKAVVLGVKRLLTHKRLRGRVIAHFSVLEVSTKHGREHPCAHVHTLLVTKPMDKGRHRISQTDWISIWESCCPLARKRQPGEVVRYNSKKRTPNSSLMAKLVPQHGEDIVKVIHYCTKWATPRRAAGDYRKLLSDPDNFIARQDALFRITRFFGDLHYRQNRLTPRRFKTSTPR